MVALVVDLATVLHVGGLESLDEGGGGQSPRCSWLALRWQLVSSVIQGGRDQRASSIANYGLLGEFFKYFAVERDLSRLVDSQFRGDCFHMH